MKVVILGSGLAGLLAAKAAEDCGVDFEILTASKTSPPSFPGFTFLHDNCGLPLVPEFVVVQRIGSPKIYKEKRGYPPKVSTSWGGVNEEFTGTLGYNPYEAFTLLCGKYSGKMKELFVTRGILEDLTNHCDLVISSLPLNQLCPEGEFETVYGWLKREEGHSPSKINTAIYSGSYEDKWSRRSSMWGEVWSEYGHFVEGGLRVEKPISCKGIELNEKILLVGRKGTWDKREMAHHSYYKTYGRIKELLTQTLSTMKG